MEQVSRAAAVPSEELMEEPNIATNTTTQHKVIG